MGLFANTVVIRTSTAESPSFRELLRRVWRTSLAAFDHQELPFETLLQVLHQKDNLQRAEMTSTLLLYQNAIADNPHAKPMFRFAAAGQDQDSDELIPSGFELILDCRETPHGLEGSVTFDQGRYSAAGVETLISLLKALLVEAVGNPDRPLHETPIP